MEGWCLLITGFLLGIVSSGAVAIWYAWVITPRLAIQPETGQPQIGGNPGKRHRFYHLHVTNLPIRLLAWCLGRQPAWYCRARLDVFRMDGSPLMEGVMGRWTSQPEPRSRTGPGGFPLFDWALWVQGQRCDIHEHCPEPLVIAFKEEGDENCYLFNNDSYRDTSWGLKKPEWQIQPGDYVLHVTLLYQRKARAKRFRLRNAGRALDDLQIEPLAEK